MIREQIEKRLSGADTRTVRRFVKRAEELRRRGLQDDGIILQLIADEYESGYKEPKLIWAGMYDKMNHMCRCYMDRTVRFALYYDYIPDIEALKKVVICLFEKSPIFLKIYSSGEINSSFAPEITPIRVRSFIFLVSTCNFLQTSLIIPFWSSVS